MSFEGQLEQALATAFADYDRLWEGEAEWGRVFWTGRDGLALEPGELRMGTWDHVDLFPLEVRERFCSGLKEDRQDLLGTYHAHHDGLTFMQQFPSADDLAAVSSLVDYWGANDGRAVPVSIEFDLIQGGDYGDIFVVSRKPERNRFGSYSEQERHLTLSLAAFEAEVRGAAQLTEPDSHAEYACVARRVLQVAARHLKDRVTITLHPYGASPVEPLA